MENPTLAFGLSGLVDYSPILPFIDIMKVSRPLWAMYSGNEWGQDHAALVATGVLDANGWPTQLPPSSTGIRTTWAWADGTEVAAGPWVMTWEGSGTITLANGINQVVSDHRVEFETANKAFWLTITSTDPGATGDYIRNIKIVLAKYEALHDAGEKFNPDWLALIQEARQVRFMDWMKANSTTVPSTWAERCVEGYVNYTTVAGASVEIMVELANKIGADPWFTIHHLADDDFVTQFATYVRDNLNPGLKAYFEYSNETWNTLFPQAAWCKLQAETVWGLPNGWSNGAWLSYYTKRATQIATIINGIFSGADASRVKNIIGIQTAAGVTWSLTRNYLIDELWQDNEPESYIDPAATFDAVAVTTYFGNNSNWTEIRDYAMSHTAEEGYVWLAEKLMTLSYSSSIPEKAQTWQAIDAIVEGTFGLDLILYEGGQHVHTSISTSGWTTEQITTFQTFMTGFVRSQQMADLYQASWDNWVARGDGPYMHFQEAGAPSGFGSWGLYASPTDTNPRQRLLVAMNGQNAAELGLTGGKHYLPQKTAQFSAGGLIEFTARGGLAIGGDGQDIAVLSGPRSGYSITRDEAGYHFTGADGVVTLKGAFNCVRFS